MKRPFTKLFPFFVPLKNIARLASLSLAVGVLAMPAQANGSSSPSAQSVRQTAAASTSLPNGVYLYGQSAEPEQIGQAYFVFEVNQGKVLGAFYMPRSSFDCAYGTFEPGQVALTVVDTYEKTRHPYAIALQNTASVATRGNPALVQANLEGFQRLNKLSANDQRILNTCKQTYPSVLK